MKVKELIKALQEQDPEAETYIVWRTLEGDEFENIVEVAKDDSTVDIYGSSHLWE